MNAPMLPGLATAAGAVTAVALNSLWEDALLIVSVWLLLRAWPGLNAATRYIVWSATLIATVVVPIATTLPFLTPSSSSVAMTATAAKVHIPMVTQTLAAAPAGAPRRAEKPANTHAEAPAATQPAALVPRFPERFRMTLPLPVTVAILAIWAMLAAFAFVRLGIGLFRLEQLKRDALPLPVEYRDAMARWTSARKGSREVRLCVSDDIDVPVAVGLFDAMILIPRALLERLSESEVDQISLHELAHLRRADDWTNGFQRLALALFAWNPGVVFVGQQLDLEREVACDDWVLASTGMVRPYAVCLAKMAETSSWPHRPMAAPGVFATRKHISLRIERLLGAGRNAATNLSLGPAAATVAIVGALAFAMQLVAPSVAASMQPEKPPTFAAPTETFASPPVKTKQVFKYLRVFSSMQTTTHEATSASPVTSASSAASAKPSAEPRTPEKAVPHTIHLPATHVVVPETDVHVPETNVHVPATDIHVPGQTIAIPPINIDIPQISKIAKARVKASSAAMTSGMSVGMAAGMASAAGVVGSLSALGTHAATATHTVIVADASSVRNCTGCDFSGVNWSGKDMRNANLTGSDLSRANLAGTNFSGGTFSGVDFSRANLHGASFRNARLTGCDFAHANLTGVDFTGATLSGCQFNDTQLGAADMRGILSTCIGCDFSNANLSGRDLSHVHASGIDFSNANLTGANLSDSTFTGVDFSRARLAGANLTNTVFSGCDLGSTDLSHVDLSRAKFIGTDLSSHGSPRP